MQPIHDFHHLAGCGLLVAATLASGCATTATPPKANAPAVKPPAIQPAPRHEPTLIPVVRYGRYTLVELAPASAQQDLLLQVVDVALPDTRNATVGDALRHVLLRSGYQLCSSDDIAALDALPLPAAHYRLRPLLLRDALLTLAGPAWELQVDEGARRVCFSRVRPPVLPASAPAFPLGRSPLHTAPAPLAPPVGRPFLLEARP